MSANSENLKSFWELCFTKTPRTYEFASGTFGVTIYLRELILHLFFLVSVCVIALNSITPTTFHLTSALTYQFVEASDNNFRYIFTMEDFWLYTQDRLPHLLFSEFWYNEQPLVGGNKVLYQNTLLGTVRMRQLRVRNNSCHIANDFQLSVFDCFGHYSYENEDKSHFGPAHNSAWIYTSEADLQGTTHSGIYAKYGGGGYYIDLGPSYEDSIQKISFLKSNLWLERATRAVFIDFTIYNPNLDLLSVVKLICEFPPVGGLATTWMFQTGNVNQLDSTLDYVILAFEVVFSVFILYYWIREIGEIAVKRWQYYKDPWNLVDMSILVLSPVAIFLGIYRYLRLRDLIKDYLETPGSYLNFESFGYWQSEFQYILATVAFLTWIRLFEFISFSSTLVQLSNTLSRCAPDLFGFGVMLLVVFVAFGQMGFLIFGSQLPGFRNFVQSIFTLLRIVLGDTDFEGIQAAHRVLGPLYFFAFIFFVYFVLMQMFLAIIADTFSQVKTEYEAEGKPVENPFSTIIHHLRYPEVNQGDQDEDKEPVTQDHSLDRNTLARVLRARGLNHADIQDFFAHFEIDAETRVDKEELKNLTKTWDGLHGGTEGSEDERSYGRAIADLQREVRELQDAIETLIRTNTATGEL